MTRELLTADRTYYVRTDGSDTNSGLANDPANAFLTLQCAADLIAATIDTGISTATVQVGAGTFVGVRMLRPFVGSGWVEFAGDVTTPDNVVITAAPGGAGFQATFQAAFRVKGFKIACGAISAGLYASAGGLIEQTGKMDFGAIANGAFCAHVNATLGGNIVLTADYAISGCSWAHLMTDVGGALESTLSNVTLSGTPNFTGSFAVAYRNGVMRVPNITFSGSATGQRKVAMEGGGISTMSGNPSYFPGNSVGVVLGGWYD